jgi:hypothetical protein
VLCQLSARRNFISLDPSRGGKKKSPGTNILGSSIGTIVYHNMAGDLAKSGLYIDELSKVRVLEPEVAHETSELKEQCRDFVESKY